MNGCKKPNPGSCQWYHSRDGNLVYYLFCVYPACNLSSVNRFQPSNLLFLHPNPSLPLTVPFWFRAKGHLYLDLADSEISAWLCQASSGMYRHVHEFLRRLTLPKPEHCSPSLPTGSCAPSCWT